MPKTKIAVKPKKQKLSKEERSQIAKDRWVKRRAAVAERHKPAAEQDASTPAPPPDSGVFTISTDSPVTATSTVTLTTPPGPPVLIPDAPPVVDPAPQLAPVKPPKPKRVPQPKEFSGALKAAEKRLAAAINERAESMGRLAGLNAEIPSLIQIIQALKGSGTYTPPTPFDFSGSVPNAQAFAAPMPQFPNPLEAIGAGQPAPPISRATGGAVQFGPEVLGALEGPEDDDNPDKFLVGPAAGPGWIGG